MKHAMATALPRPARFALLALLAMLAFAAVAIPATAEARKGNPPGANGTIKIDGIPFDGDRNNEPHVGCDFRVKFQGFDRGPNVWALVVFEAQPPTGRGEFHHDWVFIGGGDTVKAYNLDQIPGFWGRGFKLHPNQGFHLKVTVRTWDDAGKETRKSKVFWVEGCLDP